MAVGDIEHSELPDDLLHEPKGASTAAAGTVYIADGTGSGAFGKVGISSLDIAVPSLTEAVLGDTLDTVTVNGNTLSQPIDGSLIDVQAIAGIPQEFSNTINKNTAEIYRLYLNIKDINDAVKSNIETLSAKQNELIQKLKSIGLLND